MSSRFVVGIDLGTTNCALAYVDTGVAESKDPVPAELLIPQVVQPGAVDARPLLPSFLMLPPSKFLFLQFMPGWAKPRHVHPSAWFVGLNILDKFFNCPLELIYA